MVEASVKAALLVFNEFQVVGIELISIRKKSSRSFVVAFEELAQDSTGPMLIEPTDLVQQRHQLAAPLGSACL